MKAGWQVKPLGEVCEIFNGGTPKSGVSDYWDGGVNWLTPKDMGQMLGRYISETPRKISAAGLNNSSARLVPPYSVIMSTRAPIGHLAINESPMAFNQGCRGMVPGNLLDPVFLFHFLSANIEALNALGTGATFKELSASALKGFPIPLPPLDEQKRIVAVLDEAFEGLDRARANVEANLADARELWARLSGLAFQPDGEGWQEAELGTLAEFRNGLNYTRSSKGEAIRIVGVGDFQSNALIPIGTLGEIVIDGKLADDDRLKPGDIVAVRSNGNKALIGRVMMLPETDEVISFSGFTIRIRLVSERLLPEYLLQFMRTPAIRETLTSGGGGSNISNLNQGQLSRLRIKFPSLERQREILDRVDSTNAYAAELLDQYGKQIADLTSLRQSLLQKGFSGELG